MENDPTICFSNNKVKLIDQTLLPGKFKYIYCKTTKQLWQAIKCLSVRGAPALGVAGAFGVVLGANEFKGKDVKKFIKHLYKVCDYMASSRPTAVNLFNCLDEMRQVIKDNSEESIINIKKALKRKADKIYEFDRRVCRKMGDYGAKLIKNKQSLMTICNAGALATVDYGTALGVFYSARRMAKKFEVYSCETRPLLQGARLTTWELLRARIKTTLICDNMAATLMQQGKIDGIFTGADRIAANGDSANKIGTYNLAVLAKYHKVPFYIVAPLSTFDMKTKTGKGIPIEQRGKEEVTSFRSEVSAPQNVNVYNPAFDVTPHKLIHAIITEAGIIKPPFKANILKAFKKNG